MISVIKTKGKKKQVLCNTVERLKMSLSLAALLSNTHYIHTEKNKDEAIVIMMLSHSSFFFLSFSVLLLHSTFLYIFCQKPLSYVFILDFLCTSFKYGAAHCLVVCYKKSKTFFSTFSTFLFFLPFTFLSVAKILEGHDTQERKKRGRKCKRTRVSRLLGVHVQTKKANTPSSDLNRRKIRCHMLTQAQVHERSPTTEEEKNLCILFKKVVIFTTTAASFLLFFGTIFPCVFPHYFCEIRAGVTTTAKHQAIKVHLPVQC